MARLLFGDIGGTNCRLDLFEVKEEDIDKPLSRGREAPGTSLHSKTFQNDKFGTFMEIVRTFLSEVTGQRVDGAGISAACFAVAGPVTMGSVHFTNRESWSFSETILATAFPGIRQVKLINDFASIGFALLTLEDSETEIIHEGDVVPGAPIVCVGAGTGLGECYLTTDANGDYTAYASEGGHTDWAPRNDLEYELLSFLRKRFEQKARVSVERVVSGHGLVNIFDFFVSKFGGDIDPAVLREITSAPDKAAAIARHAKAGERLCNQAMDVFVAAYGSEVGNTALKWLPHGGIYLCGGMAPKNIDRFRGSTLFRSAFEDKGRLSPTVRTMQVKVVLNENIGRRGAHYVAFKMLQKQRAGPQPPRPLTPAATDKIREASGTAARGCSVAVAATAFACACAAIAAAALRGACRTK